MSSSFDASTDPNETWGAYRKLIIETLRRLDERTLELNDGQNAHETRIVLLENKKPEEKIDDLKKSVETLKTTVDGINTQLNVDKGKRTMLNVLLNLGWGIVVIFISAVMNGKINLS